jgi:hypothetical protein
VRGDGVIMPRYFVTQPNGLFAEFSTVVDNFTGWNFSEAKMREACNDNPIAAGRAIADESPIWGYDGTGMCCNQKPLRGWHDCLDTILHCHGTAKLVETLLEMREAWDIHHKSNANS